MNELFRIRIGSAAFAFFFFFVVLYALPGSIRGALEGYGIQISKELSGNLGVLFAILLIQSVFVKCPRCGEKAARSALTKDKLNKTSLKEDASRWWKTVFHGVHKCVSCGEQL